MRPILFRTGGGINRCFRAVAIAASLCAAIAQAGVVNTGFDTDAQGWAAAGNGGGTVQWLADDGQPTGHLTISDASDGWAYFAAPTTYRAPVLAGGRLSFDLRHTTDPAHPTGSAVRVALVGAGLTLVAESTLPTAVWAHYEFVLGLPGHFRVLSSSADVYDPFAREATAVEWAAVLASLNSFYISADYSSANQSSGGFETTGLDNVRLSATPLASVPEPGTWALLGLACALLALLRRRRPVQ
jgi:hypothetical protein